MKLFRAFLRRHSLAAGLVLMFLLTWPIDLANSGILPLAVPMPIVLVLGWGFIAASLIMTGLTLRRGAVIALLKRFMVWRVGWQWWLVAGLFFPAVYLIAMLLNIAVTNTPPDFSPVYAYRIFGPGASLPVLVVPFFLVDALTNGEEMGWRGYALPRLQARHSAIGASLVLGVIWGFWHLPKFLAPQSSGSFALLLADTVAKSVLFTWLYNNTRGSLLLVTVFHATGNTAAVFLPVANLPGPQQSAYAVSIGLIALVAVAITLFAGPARLSRQTLLQTRGWPADHLGPV